MSNKKNRKTIVSQDDLILREVKKRCRIIAIATIICIILILIYSCLQIIILKNKVHMPSVITDKLEISDVSSCSTVSNKVLKIAPVFVAKTTSSPKPLPTAAQEDLVVKKPKKKWKPSEDEVIVAAKMMYGEARGESDERCAATLWVAINRTMDPKGRWSKDLIKVIEQKNQFTGYSRSNPVTSRLKRLAKDVLRRHHREQEGEKNVGRTLPPNYYFFGGSTGLNRFRKGSKVDGHFWDWSLPNPYK